MRKKILIGVGIFVALAVIALVAGLLQGKSQGLTVEDMFVELSPTPAPVTRTPIANSTPEITNQESMDNAMDELKEQVKDAEPNTSAMVDKIALQAREDAKLIDDKKVQEAISFIRDTYPDYFTDNEIMEKTMYYGYLLDYAYEDSDPYAKLGVDTYQVVKYVYRGAESVEDEATQANLKQLKDSLDNL